MAKDEQESISAPIVLKEAKRDYKETLGLITDVLSCVCSCFLAIIGVYLVFAPCTRKPQGIFDKLHWFLNGLFFIVTGAITAVYLAWTRLMKWEIVESTDVGWMLSSLMQHFGIIKSDMGRAVFLLITGIYVFPTLNILVVNAPHTLGFFKILGNITGVMCMCAGLFHMGVRLSLLCMQRRESQIATSAGKWQKYGATADVETGVVASAAGEKDGISSGSAEGKTADMVETTPVAAAESLLAGKAAADVNSYSPPHFGGATENVEDAS